VYGCAHLEFIYVIVLVWHGAHVTLVNAVLLLVERHLFFCVFVVGVHTVVGRLYISMIGHTFVSTLLQMCGYHIYIYIKREKLECIITYA
jgi:hypothetical protein